MKEKSIDQLSESEFIERMSSLDEIYQGLSKDYFKLIQSDSDIDTDLVEKKRRILEAHLLTKIAIARKRQRLAFLLMFSIALIGNFLTHQGHTTSGFLTLVVATLPVLFTIFQ